MLGISYLGIRLSQMKSSICDQWIQSKYVYRLSGIGLILIILHQIYVVPQITTIDLNTDRWLPWIRTFKGSILLIQWLMLGIVPFLLNRKVQYSVKSFTMVWPFFLLASLIWWTLDTPDYSLWFIRQTRLILIGLTVLFYAFGNIYEPNRKLLEKKEIRETWKWFAGSLVGLLIIGFIFGKMDMRVYYAGMGMLYICFYAIFLGARAYAGERENHTFDYLSIRPIEPKTILGVKYKNGFIQILILTFIVTLWSNGTMDYLQSKMDLSPFLNFSITLWLFSFSFLVSLVTRDTIRAALIGFTGGVITLSGAFIFFIPKPFARGMDYYYIYVFIVLLVFIYGMIGLLHESIQRKHLIWKSRYLGMILCSISFYFYGQPCFYGSLKPTNTIPNIMDPRRYSETLTNKEHQWVVISDSHSSKYRWNVSMIDISNPLNPVLLKPHFNIKGYFQYHFCNNTTMITMEEDNTGTQVVMYDFSDFAHPRETYRKMLSTDTEITYYFAYHTRNVAYFHEQYRDYSKKYDELLKQITAEAKLKSLKLSKGEINSQLNSRLHFGDVRINLNDYKDIQHIKREKINQEIDGIWYSSDRLKENYLLSYEDRYSQSGKNSIYDISDENHPRLVYQTQFNRADGWHWNNHYLWGQWWSGMTAQGNYLYGSNRKHLLSIYDIQNIQNPKRISSIAWSMLDDYAFTGSYRSDRFTIHNNLLVIQYVRGFAFVDISNPKKPVLIGKYNVQTDDGFLQGNYYYAWNYKDMFIFDISKYIGRKS